MKKNYFDYVVGVELEWAASLEISPYICTSTTSVKKRIDVFIYYTDVC